MHLALPFRTSDYTGNCFNNSAGKHCSALRDVSINKAMLLTGPSCWQHSATAAGVFERR